VPLRSNNTRARVAAALADVGANSYANQAIGRLSGGEQQRLRLAQALVADPVLLLADEPLLSLDPAAQQAVAALLDQRRTSKGTAVVLVTHEINPLLPYADRVLYLANGQWAIGPTREVLTSETLTRLYGAPVDVLDIRGRLIIVGGDEASTGMPGDHPHHVHDDSGRHVH
jgi:zinc/manganese transport system ATP-binding protein